MLFEVGWWVASYKDRNTVHDRVSRTVIRALKEAGVVLPYRQDRVDLTKV